MQYVIIENRRPVICFIMREYYCMGDVRVLTLIQNGKWLIANIRDTLQIVPLNIQ